MPNLKSFSAPAFLSSDCTPCPTIDHGGESMRAARLFPHAPTPWIDLSTGINPHAFPVGVLPDSAFTRLPESGDFAALEAVAARAYGVDDAASIVAAPGAQALIQLLPHIIAGAEVGVLSPTYGEHAAVWRAAGRRVVEVDKASDLKTFDIAVIVNPNNPDGRIIARDALMALAGRTRLIVDESFADFSPEISFAQFAAQTGAVVLRSFGKTYGLAGVRLGFAIAAPDVRRRLAQALGPWAVSGPAIALGRRALGDYRWLAGTADRLQADCIRLDRLLARSGFLVIGGTRLFRCAESVEAASWLKRLGEAGIHVRAFSDRPHRLRFGLPPDEGWARLEAVLR